MIQSRTRTARVWPTLITAACLWVALISSAQAPVTVRIGESVYISAQRGCIAAWYWSPAERPTLGLHDTLTLKSSRFERLNFIPHLWCDPWGYGIGTPLWIPALILTAVAARRYAVTTARDAPPEVRSARRWVVVTSLSFGCVLLGMLVSAGGRQEQLLAVFRQSIYIQNGSLVLAKPDPNPQVGPTSTLVGSRLVFTTTSVNIVETDPVGFPWIDLLPRLAAGTPFWRLSLPLWPLVLVLAWIAWRLRSRAAFRGAGLCVNCGYSLVGLSADATCPECGHLGAMK